MATSVNAVSDSTTSGGIVINGTSSSSVSSGNLGAAADVGATASATGIVSNPGSSSSADVGGSSAQSAVVSSQTAEAADTNGASASEVASGAQTGVSADLGTAAGITGIDSDSASSGASGADTNGTTSASEIISNANSGTAADINTAGATNASGTIVSNTGTLSADVNSTTKLTADVVVTNSGETTEAHSPTVLDDDVEFDVVISRKVKYSADVPEYAMENGAYASDSVIKKPAEITLVALLADRPVTYKARHGYEEGRAQRMKALLLDKYFSGDLHSLTTPNEVFNNVAITSLEVPDDDYADAIEVTIGLKVVNITEAETSEYEYSGDTESADSTSTSEASEEETARGQSILASVFGIE